MGNGTNAKSTKKKCDGKTIYTCTMEHIEEKGEIKHWHAINIAELIKASNNNPPDFTFPIDRTIENWPDECSCPIMCSRMVRDTTLKSKKGLRVARRRIGAGGQVLEIQTKTIIRRTIEVAFVCVEVIEDKKLSISFDPDSEKEKKLFSLESMEKQLKDDSILNLKRLKIMAGKCTNQTK